ncbi:MAG TPA: hypothetical protein DCG41_07380, partial [Verrucomicrobiales bacterium]|nr:hypothetical protein [Verrucomicrobiales bacterium]
ERFDRHRKIAKWTWPLWMYVSVTGVIVYLFLYVLFPEHTEKKLKIKPDAAPTEENAAGE